MGVKNDSFAEFRRGGRGTFFLGFSASSFFLPFSSSCSSSNGTILLPHTFVLVFFFVQCPHLHLLIPPPLLQPPKKAAGKPDKAGGKSKQIQAAKSAAKKSGGGKAKKKVLIFQLHATL